MLKKAGILTIGVSAALLAAAPLASAGEYQGDDNGGNDHGHHNNDHGNHHGHHKGHGDHGKQHGVGNVQCSAESGDVKGNRTEGILALGPILDGNAGQLLSCNSFLNDVASGNHINALNAGI